MLFITNRSLKQSHRSRANRSVDFDLNSNDTGQSLFFCRRTAAEEYVEIKSETLLGELKSSGARELLLYIHGFNNMPEDAFRRAEELQAMFDQAPVNSPDHDRLVEVVPIIWPSGGGTLDYLDDQLAADASGFAFARGLERLRIWQGKHADDDTPCLKRINILAHSMGNRVYREAMRIWCGELLRNQPPLIFRNSFLMAADVVNESLEQDHSGKLICHASRNAVVYYASDDLALRASKAVNLANRVASRRLGHTGPEDISRVPTNVFSIDCDDINTKYDRPSGHTYFLSAPDGNPGVVFKHMKKCIESGRAGERRQVLDR